MRAVGLRGLAAVAIATAVAGCGGKSSAPTTRSPATTTTRAVPTFTSDSDRRACAGLVTQLRLVSALVSGSVAVVTNSIHPAQLAARTGLARHNLLLSANDIAAVDVPQPLEPARNRLVRGLRRFAADFGRARRSVLHHDLPAAAAEIVDDAALTDLKASTQTMNRACGT
jgi:hypothetical protein